MLIIFALLQVFLPSHVVNVNDISISIDIEDLIDYRLDESNIVRDDDEPPGILSEILTKPVNRFGIKMVCRLIEDESLGAPKEKSGKLYTSSLTARKSEERIFKEPFGQTEVHCDCLRL